jgi:hypothetical protein
VTETPKPASYEFSKHIGALCVKNRTNVYKLADLLKVDPVDLLKMTNGKIAPTKQVITGLAKALDSDVRYLEKLAAEIPRA